MTKELYEVGEMPPLGEVPKKMHAWVVRRERYGQPGDSFQREVILVPPVGDDEVLVYVMAAGVNYNNVWAALGLPVDVIAARKKQGEPEDFHIGGSDASGIVFRAGKDVKELAVGDEVVIHCGSWSRDCSIASDNDPMYSPTFRIWGYETNYGSFAQFTRVQAHQCVPKPKNLAWDQAGAYMLVAATAYRMLHKWDENAVKKGDVVLVWGGAGGLGSMAIQIARAAGAIPIAVVSSPDKFDYCRELGAAGLINRKDFDHWGMLPHWKDTAGYKGWLGGVRQFGKAIWDILGERRGPDIVFEHPGESTIPTSIFVCETGGMVVVCAGTTGYNATVDLRYLWMRQKRLQGSHFANDDQAVAVNNLMREGKVNPCLSRTFTWDELPLCHQLMYENKHPHGNMAILVGCTEAGAGVAEEETMAHPDTKRTVPEPILDLKDLDAVETELPEDSAHVGEVFYPRLPSVRVDSALQEVARLMADEVVHAVAVLAEDGSLAGVISQTDVVLARQKGSPVEVSRLSAASIMTTVPITVTVDETIQQAITLMTRHKIHRLIVVDKREGKEIPLGVCAMTDIIRYMFALGPRQ